MMTFSNIQEFWRHRRIANVLLLPLAAVFAVLVRGRRYGYQKGIFRTHRNDLPVVVVGNVVIGGGGKTPTVIALVQALQKHGLNPGVVSRGFGGKYANIHEVKIDDDWQYCGDEPLLIRRQTAVPVCLARNRHAAVKRLAELGCDIAISDDGLQHYAMHRDMEICLINGDYGLGNEWLLPAGPLREPQRRVAECDITAIVNGTPTSGAYAIKTSSGEIYQLAKPQKLVATDTLKNKKVAVLAGIAHPAAFFAAVESAGIVATQTIAVSDHQRLNDAALAAVEADIVLMSEKDAVKYSSEDTRLYVLPMVCRLPDDIITRILSLVPAYHA